MQAYLIIDGQWGSSGKGLLAGKLALDRKPDVVVCNFGPNAGHTFIKGDDEDKEFVMTQQLPTGLVRKGATLLLGPGAIINPEILFNEIERLDPKYNIKDRLFIHPNASIVTDMDRDREGALVSIGSTRKGTASAACRKIMRVPEGAPRRACELKDSSCAFGQDIARYVTSTQSYNSIIKNACLIQVESAQGIELSLSRGHFYPYCTGRDVTPEQIMNDVAVPMRSLAETCLVIRTYPIRVGNEFDGDGNMVGWSGPVYPDHREMSWDELSKRLSREVLERTTVTKKVRRLFTFSMEQFEHALWVAGPSSIFVNYVNYLVPGAYDGLIRSSEDAASFVDRIRHAAVSRGSVIKWLGFGPAYEDVMPGDMELV